MARTQHGTWVAAAALLTIASSSRPSRACDYTMSNAFPGPLYANPTEPGVEPVPRNIAFLARMDGDTVVVGNLESGEPILAKAIATAPDGDAIVRPEAPLPANTTFTPLVFQAPTGQPLTTGDFVDETAPQAPEVANGDIQSTDNPNCSSCGDSTSLELTLSRDAVDEPMSQRGLVYAVYLSKTADGAATAPTPIALLYPPSLWTFVDEDWEDSDAFITVSAYDIAGNESARSQPVRVNAAPGACGLALGSRGRSFSVLTLAAAVVAGACRRLGRRLRQSS